MKGIQLSDSEYGVSILLQAHGKQSIVHIYDLFCTTSTVQIRLVH